MVRAVRRFRPLTASCASSRSGIPVEETARDRFVDAIGVQTKSSDAIEDFNANCVLRARQESNVDAWLDLDVLSDAWFSDPNEHEIDGRLVIEVEFQYD
jgi:hypothetical protein